MTVKEMLLACNRNIATAIHYNRQEPPKIEDFRQFREMHMCFFEEIAAIQPVAGDYVILGSCFDTGDPEKAELHLYKKAEVLTGVTRCTEWEQPLNWSQLSGEELAAMAPEKLQYRFPDSYDMETMPWEELLGAEVFEPNLYAFGHDRMAAMVIQEMSFWGLSHEQSKRGQERLWKKLDEAMKEMEEMESCSKPFDTVAEMMAALNMDETDLAVCEESEEVRRVLEDFDPVNLIKAAIAKYWELLRYFEKPLPNK